LYRVLLAAMTDGDKSYLAYMAARILEMRRVLKPTGSIYLHCDPTMSHYLKLVMDAVFGRDNFRNEIIWRIGWVSGFKTQKRGWIRNHDTLLYYVGGPDATKGFNKEYIPYPPDYRRRDGKKPTGKGIPIEDTWNSHSGDVLNSIMIMSFSTEKMGYPTQKPLALLERIIKASSNEGDVVLDPFCGCATTCVAAESLGREWAGIDLSPKAVELVKHRLADQHGVFGQIVARTDVPRRTDLGRLPAPGTHRMTLYGLQGGDCAGCGEHFRPRHLEVDHIIAQSKGGTDHAENLQLLCGHCNRVKGDRGMAYLKTKLQLDTRT
jgi:site-specific DNA-methyltransferase (adenine-specific)